MANDAACLRSSSVMLSVRGLLSAVALEAGRKYARGMNVSLRMSDFL